MLELGDASDKEHYDLGLKLGKLGLGSLALVGEHSEHIKKGAEKAKPTMKHIDIFKNPLSALAFVIQRAQSGDLVLVKGSHSTELSKIMEALT
jgi:UDP-N-acetylmuramoyl-tripeptide--D-alanyl-D-alanine ligase